jgi:N-terminal glutamine amidase
VWLVYTNKSFEVLVFDLVFCDFLLCFCLLWLCLKTVKMEQWPSGKESVKYTHCYCEENVYLLMKSLCENTMSWAVFVSNKEKVVGFDGHSDDGEIIYWDYHVVCVTMSKKDKEVMVFDHDSNPCSFPCKLGEWLESSFSKVKNAKPMFR